MGIVKRSSSIKLYLLLAIPTLRATLTVPLAWSPNIFHHSTIAFSNHLVALTTLLTSWLRQETLLQASLNISVCKSLTGQTMSFITLRLMEWMLRGKLYARICISVPRPWIWSSYWFKVHQRFLPLKLVLLSKLSLILILKASHHVIKVICNHQISLSNSKAFFSDYSKI